MFLHAHLRPVLWDPICGISLRSFKSTLVDRNWILLGGNMCPSGTLWGSTDSIDFLFRKSVRKTFCPCLTDPGGINKNKSAASSSNISTVSSTLSKTAWYTLLSKKQGIWALFHGKNSSYRNTTYGYLDHTNYNMTKSGEVCFTNTWLT